MVPKIRRTNVDLGMFLVERVIDVMGLYLGRELSSNLLLTGTNFLGSRYPSEAHCKVHDFGLTMNTEQPSVGNSEAVYNTDPVIQYRLYLIQYK
jgi:hypothetical protein